MGRSFVKHFGGGATAGVNRTGENSVLRHEGRFFHLCMYLQIGAPESWDQAVRGHWRPYYEKT